MKKLKILLKTLGYQRTDLVLIFLLLTFVFTTMLLCGSVNQAIPQLIDNRINHNTHAKLIYATNMNTERALEENEAVLNQIDGVASFFPQQARLLGTTVLMETKGQTVPVSSMISGANEKMMPAVSTGRGINMNEKEMLVPEVIATAENEKFDGQLLVDTEVTFQVEEHEFADGPLQEIIGVTVHEERFKIVGTYDQDLGYYFDNELITSLTQVERMNRLAERQLAKIQPRDDTWLVLVDNYEQVDSMITLLEQNDFLTDRAYEFNFPVCYMILYVARILGVCITIMGVLMLGVMQLRSINKRMKEVCLLKTIGYRDAMIAAVICLKTEMVGIGAFMVALILNSLLYSLVAQFIFGYTKATVMTWGFVLVNVCLVLIIPLAVMCASLRKIIKTPPIKLMKEDE